MLEEIAAAADRLAELAAHPDQAYVPLSFREAHPDWRQLVRELYWQASLIVDDDFQHAQDRLTRYGLAKNTPEQAP
jgi:hypothetical protein